ncbi:unnamed protein product [Peniophora sp. CBMAI 1063]|nr:unnamed protein product [Peniophora sp. CBMAI 1063]
MRLSWSGYGRAHSDTSPRHVLLEHWPPWMGPRLPALAHGFPDPPVVITLHSPIQDSPWNELPQPSPPTTPVLLAANGPPHLQLLQAVSLPAPSYQVSPPYSVIHERVCATSPEHQVTVESVDVGPPSNPAVEVDTSSLQLAVEHESEQSCKRCSEKQLPCGPGNVRPCGHCIQFGQGDTCDDAVRPDLVRRGPYVGIRTSPTLSEASLWTIATAASSSRASTPKRKFGDSQSSAGSGELELGVAKRRRDSEDSVASSRAGSIE